MELNNDSFLHIQQYFKMTELSPYVGMKIMIRPEKYFESIVCNVSVFSKTMVTNT